MSGDRDEEYRRLIERAEPAPLSPAEEEQIRRVLDWQRQQAPPERID